MNLIYSGSSLLFIWPIGDTQRCSKTHERTLSSLLNVTKSFMTLMNASDFGITNLQTKSPLPLKSKICHEHVLWMADAQESTHPSYDDTAGCSLAQNHRDKQKSRLSAYLKLRSLVNHRQPRISVLRAPNKSLNRNSWNFRDCSYKSFCSLWIFTTRYNWLGWLR